MTYDFDKPVDRSGSGDLKHEALQSRWGRTDLLPLWVADMDWEAPPCITAALRQRLEHPLYGYTVTPPDYWDTIIQWVRDHHGWTMQPEWITFIPGVVRGIGIAVNVFSRPGDKVIIQPPVYHPFRLTSEGNGREVVMNPLRPLPDGGYTMDFEQLAEVADDRCRLLILSNPHNPAGICWEADTLRRLAALCHERGIVVLSDEIHADLALFGHRHVPFASVSPEAEACSVTFCAPSKTFNIAGIVSSWAAVPNPALRKPYYDFLTANELNEPTLFAPIATQAAFREGEEWRRQMLRYVEANVELVISYCREHIPQVRPLRPEASFLVWLDCRALGLNRAALLRLFIHGARLALNDGEMFGPGGEGHMRLNVATQRATLLRALDQLRAAVAAL